MATDKQLKFTMVVDQNSVQQVQNAVKSMIDDFDKLTAAIARASQAMGGLMGGGKAGAPAGVSQTIGSSSYHHTPGATSSSTGVPSGTGGAGQNMTDAMRQQAEAFRTAAAATATAMTAMSSSITLAHATVMPKLQAMTNQVALLRGGMGGGQLALPSGMGGQPGGPASGQTVNVNGMPSGGGGGSYTPTPGAASQPGGGGGGGGGMGGLAMMGIIAAAIPAVVSQTLNMTKSTLMLGTNLGGERGTTMASLVNSGLNGDPTNAIFRARISEDNTKRVLQAQLASGVTNVPAGVLAAIKAKAGGLMGTTNVDPHAALSTAIDTGAIGDQLAQLDAEKATHLLDTYMIQQYVAQQGARTNIMRRLGNGVKTKIVTDASGRQRSIITADPTGDFMVQSANLGLSDDSRLGARQAIAQYAGERAGGRFATQALWAGGAGFQGAEKIFGMSAAAGQGNFAGAVFGHENMDMHAASAVGGMLSDQMAATGRAGDASGIFGALQFSGAFNGGAGDMMAAQRARLGMDIGDRLSQGGSDGFQMMMNLHAARQALGPSSMPMARQMLATMSLTDRLLLASGGRKASGVEAALGIGQTQAMQTSQALMYSIFHRARVGGQTGKVADTIRAIQSTGGDPEKLAHLGISQSDISIALQAAGTQVGFGKGGAMEGYGDMGASILMGNLMRPGKKGGVGDRRGPGEKVAGTAAANRQQMINDYMREHAGELETGQLQAAAQAFADSQLAANPNAAAGKLITDFESLHQALRPLIMELNNRYGGGNKATPKK